MNTTHNLFSVGQTALPTQELAGKYLLVTDEIIGYEAYSDTVVYTSPVLDLETLDKVLVESFFSPYMEWTDAHCQRPEVPASEALDWYPGTFGDSKHLKYKDADYPVKHSIGGLLAGTDKTFIEDEDNTAPEASWGKRLRIFHPGDTLPVFPTDTVLVELP